jgi:tetratricopeptide (TPR) repeat protein
VRASPVPASAPPGPVASARPWLFNAPLDLLVGCGAWSLPFLALVFWLQRDAAGAASLALAFYALGLFCNNPHYMATLHRAYHTAGDFAKYRFFTVYVTALLALVVVLVHLAPGLVPWVVTLYLTWSPWHYTGQNFGIAQLLLRRAGAPADPAARALLHGGYVAAFVVWAATLHADRPSGDPAFLSLGVPDRLATAVQLGGALAFVGLSVAAFLRLTRTLPPRALAGPILLTATQALWFVAPALATRFGGLELPASYFSAGALAFMHCAQYLWITTYYAQRERHSPAAGATAAPRFSFLRYYGLLVIGGIALFIPGPWIASRLLGHDFVNSFVIFMALVNLHHFILDGAVWKLRDGRLARLLLGRRDPGDSPAESALHPADATPRHHLGWLFGPARAARATRLALAALLLALGALDQWQYAATTRLASDAALDRAAALNPADPRPAYRRAQRLAAAGRPDEAATLLRDLIARHPRNAPAQHLLGELIFRSGDLEAALAHYDRMAGLFRPDLAIATNRALLAADTGRADEAAERFTEALRLAPHRTELHALLGDALLAAGRPAEARRQFELFCTLYETDARDDTLLDRYLAAGLTLGQLLREAGDLPAAAARLQRTADVAATRHRFAPAAAALGRLADVQEARGDPAAATATRALAAQAEGYARAP